MTGEKPHGYITAIMDANGVWQSYEVDLTNLNLRNTDIPGFPSKKDNG